MRHVIPFTSPTIPTIEQVGGKALSLILMKNRGMSIPNGFVLSVDFFEPWMNILRNTSAWAELCNDSSKEFGKSTKLLQDMCSTLKMDKGQRDELSAAIEELHFSLKESTNVLFAVRSSSPEEDVDDASFAGAYETVLGVRKELVDDAIKKVFASSFNERVFHYKNGNGFSFDQHRMAIIVQQNIAADAAGVAFSLNPLNNCYDEGVIIANFGLGESVVGGHVTPDKFIIDKVQRKIIESTIGNKEVIISLDPNGGTKTTSRQGNGRSCITPDQVLMIADRMKDIESLFQKPIDIEWAFSHDSLFILQARPITTFLPLPAEMVSAPGEQKTLYADSTLIEQGIQEPLSVLGTDFLSEILRVMSVLFGGDATGKDGIAFTAGGRYYMNLSNSTKLLGKNLSLAPGSIGDASVKQIMDSLDITQYRPKQLPKRLRNIKLKMGFALMSALMKVVSASNNPDKYLSDYNQCAIAEVRKIEQCKMDGQSFREYARSLTAILNFFIAKDAIPLVLAPKLALARIEKLFKQESKMLHDELANLSMSLPGNKTAEMGEWLYKLASLIDFDPDENPQGFKAKLSQNKLSSEFMQEWNAFLGKFGFRCFREIDVATPRPNEQAALLFYQLKNLARSVKDRKDSRTIFEEARLKREAAYKILHDLAIQKGKKSALIFEKSYKTLKALGGYRENSKHYITMAIDKFRKEIIQKAQAFVADKRLDSPDQIFDLTIDQVDKALNDKNIDLKGLRHENTALIERIKKSHLVPQLIDSRGKVFFPPQKEIKEGEISGEPISPGIARGKVKVLNQANEKPFLPGEILVARSTDPGWTPLFINAKAIILEIGGLLQHGAVVAREYGIPCVSGIERATSKFKDGQEIEVDGSNGRIRIISVRET